LETEYGYQQLAQVTEDLNHFKDARASVRYVNSRVGIKIQWGFADGIIDVYFIELLQAGVFPAVSSPYPLKDRSHVAKSIGLSTLAEMLGHSDDPDFLLKKIYSPRTSNRRIKTIETNMPEVLAGLAHATQTYASSILQDDTSIFPQVMQFYVQLQKKYYPYTYARISAEIVDDLF
jgi:hypothetical protein